MGTFIFIVVVIVLGMIFYIKDTKKHKKLITENLITTHFKEKAIIQENIKKHKDKVPVLAKIVLSFTNNNDSINDFVSKAKELDPVLQNELNLEIDKIINDANNRELLEVLRWYMFTCLIISSIKYRLDAEKFDQEAKRIIKVKNGAVDFKDELCFA